MTKMYLSASKSKIEFSLLYIYVLMEAFRCKCIYEYIHTEEPLCFLHCSDKSALNGHKSSGHSWIQYRLMINMHIVRFLILINFFFLVLFKSVCNGVRDGPLSVHSNDKENHVFNVHFKCSLLTSWKVPMYRLVEFSLCIVQSFIKYYAFVSFFH